MDMVGHGMRGLLVGAVLLLTGAAVPDAQLSPFRALDEGSIYHRLTCPALQGHAPVTIDVEDITEAHAACALCRPDSDAPAVSYERPRRVRIERETSRSPDGDAKDDEGTATAANLTAKQPAFRPVYLVDRFAEQPIWTIVGSTIFHRESCVTLQGHAIVPLERHRLTPGHAACRVCFPRGAPPRSTYLPETTAWVEPDLEVPRGSLVGWLLASAVPPPPLPAAVAPVGSATTTSAAAGTATTTLTTTAEVELISTPYVSEDGTLELSAEVEPVAPTVAWADFDWTLTAVSSSTSRMSFDADVELRDALGATLGRDRLYSVLLLPGSERTLTGRVRVASALAPAVAEVIVTPLEVPKVEVASLAGDRGRVVVAETLTTATTLAGTYISWREHRVDDEELSGGVALRGGDGLEVADLDRDGYPDVVSVHEDNHYVRLAFGTPDPDEWVRVTLAEGDEVRGAENVSVADANGDGYPDILVACEVAHLVYFENPGAGARTDPWPRVIPPVTLGRGSFIRAYFGDLDGDGRPEVTAANKGPEDHATGLLGLDPGRRFLDGDEREPGARAAAGRSKSVKREISWFGLPSRPLDGQAWDEQVLDRVDIPINAVPVDLDGDGDLDIVGGSRGESRIFWFENGGGSDLRFEGHRVEASGRARFWRHRIEVTGRNVPWAPGVMRLTGMNLAFHDINHDGRLDIVLQETPWTVVWLEQPSEVWQAWQIHAVGDVAPDASVGLSVVDSNDDGYPDIMTGGYSEDPRDRDGENVTASSRVGRLAWFEHPRDLGEPWIRHDISRRTRGMYDVFVPLDLDHDGDIDFLATRGNSGSFDGVVWLEQVRTAIPTRAFVPARSEESNHLPLPPQPTATEAALQSSLLK